MSKSLRDMTVNELRQHARDLGLSSVTRLTRKESLVRAIERMQERRPDVYGMQDRAIVSVDGGGAGICARCSGRLDYSWRVRLSDGSVLALCSLCLPSTP